MGVPRTTYATIVAADSIPTGQFVQQLALFGADGEPIPVQSQGAAVASPSPIAQAAISGGESPTETEFNTLRSDHANTRTTLTNLLTSLRNANIIDT